jgi:hypothetical protein
VGAEGRKTVSTEPSDPSARKLTYTSSTDFQTSEYSAQYGLQMVKAAKLYYNGHYQWYAGHAPHSTAGTGIGVKVAVGDTGINAGESSTGAAIAIDTARSYDYVNNRSGSAADDYGHGSFDELAPRNFSFNSPYGACEACDGLGTRYEVDEELVVPDPDVSITDGAIAPWRSAHTQYFTRMLEAVAEQHGILLETLQSTFPDANLTQLYLSLPEALDP